MNIIFWLILFFIFIFLELITFSLISIWFALSSLLVILFSIYNKNIYYQFTIFTLLSIFFLLVIIKYFKKNLDIKRFDFETFNKKVKIISIENDMYVVKFKGSNWNAISKTTKYDIGDFVEILKFEGNKIILK